LRQRRKTGSKSQYPLSGLNATELLLPFFRGRDSRKGSADEAQNQ
jgi:hypothetical protein